MNRLLQGDVGSGKTIVAAYALYLSAANQLPAALMAPTEILASQHFQSLSPIFSKLNLPLALHTRSHRHDASTKCLIHLGTQALLFRQLPSQLGVVVIDEQHKFGVKVRDRLIQATPVPHLLTMSATPIPRTLSLTLYTDLDLTNLTDNPHPKKIITKIVPQPKRTLAYQFIQNRITQFHDQAFFVCPFIEDSENQALATTKAALSVYRELSQKSFPNSSLAWFMAVKNQKSSSKPFRLLPNTNSIS